MKSTTLEELLQNDVGTIYALCDGGMYVYIGKTIGSVRSRIIAHSKADTEVGKFLRSLEPDELAEIEVRTYKPNEICERYRHEEHGFIGNDLDTAEKILIHCCEPFLNTRLVPKVRE